MNKLTTGLIVGALTLGSVALVNADDDDYRGYGFYKGRYCEQKYEGMRFGNRLEAIAEELGLSKDQRDQIVSIMDNTHENMWNLRKAMRDNRLQLRDLMQQDTVDEAAIRSLAEAQGRLKGDMLVLRSKTHAKISAVLTAEQRSQWKTMRIYKPRHHHGRYGRFDDEDDDERS